MKKALFIGVFTLLIGHLTYSQKNTKPIISATDFTSQTELWESIGHGIFNFQADVMYIYGKIYVTQMMPDTENHKLPTLSEAYLYPLYNQFKKNGGEIIPGYSGDIFLILNFMAQPAQVYKQLSAEMRPFSDMLSFSLDGTEHPGKLSILIKDKNQFEKINSIKPGFLALVGTMSDIGKDVDSKKMPLIELDFTEITSWKGIGNIPFEDFTKIKDLVSKVHAQNKKISLINCPTYKTVADLILTAKVDFMNTADATRMAEYFEPAK
ncbi:MAG: hypothetical protein WC384_14960 [Prolixibacteraceae bacterium]|jgi:hypothetical protein